MELAIVCVTYYSPDLIMVIDMSIGGLRDFYRNKCLKKEKTMARVQKSGIRCFILPSLC